MQIQNLFTKLQLLILFKNIHKKETCSINITPVLQMGHGKNIL